MFKKQSFFFPSFYILNAKGEINMIQRYFRILKPQPIYGLHHSQSREINIRIYFSENAYFKNIFLYWVYLI